MSELYDMGIAGGGQLGRMLTEAAIPMGLSVVVLEKPGLCPAEQVGAFHFEAPDLYDHEGLARLVTASRVTTIETEHFDAVELGRQSATHDVQPDPMSVSVIQDKYAQHAYLADCRIPVAPFFPLESKEDFSRLTDTHQDLMIKRRFGAFDGRGNMVWNGESWEDVTAALSRPNEPEGPKLYAERLVEFDTELCGLVPRGRNGKLASYPIVETIHRNNICNVVFSPARVPDRVTDKALQLARRTVEAFNGAGMFAVEMFLTRQGRILVNEVAPRVHNSGHHTIEGNTTSQFEQHVRAITGRTLGDTSLVSPAVMINILGERNGPVNVEGQERLANLGGRVFLHLYGKEPTVIDRKMGHITVLDDDIEEAYRVALEARSLISV